MEHKLLSLFVEEFGDSDLQMIVMVKRYNDNKLVQVTFRGESNLIHQWINEIHGETVFIEIKKLCDMMAVMTYGIQHHGEVQKFERNSLALELEYLNYE